MRKSYNGSELCSGAERIRAQEKEEEMIRRLDHIILCVRDRDEWAKRIGEVLGLDPNRGRTGDEWGFDNWEFNIGDGFLGVVTPSSPDSQLERFLAHRGDSFYAISVDIGSLETGRVHFDRVGVQYSVARRDGEARLLWPSPQKATAGILFQVFDGTEPAAGTNPNLAGLRRAVVVADDLEQRVRQLRRSFDLPEPRRDAEDPTLKARTATFDLPVSHLHQQLVLASPLGAGPLAEHLRERGPSIYEWGLATSDLEAEISRLGAVGVTTQRASDGAGPTSLIDPSALKGLRFRLHQI